MGRSDPRDRDRKRGIRHPEPENESDSINYHTTNKDKQKKLYPRRMEYSDHRVNDVWNRSQKRTQSSSSSENYETPPPRNSKTRRRNLRLEKDSEIERDNNNGDRYILRIPIGHQPKYKLPITPRYLVRPKSRQAAYKIEKIIVTNPEKKYKNKETRSPQTPKKRFKKQRSSQQPFMLSNAEEKDVRHLLAQQISSDDSANFKPSRKKAVRESSRKKQMTKIYATQPLTKDSIEWWHCLCEKEQAIERKSFFARTMAKINQIKPKMRECSTECPYNPECDSQIPTTAVNSSSSTSSNEPVGMIPLPYDSNQDNSLIGNPSQSSRSSLKRFSSMRNDSRSSSVRNGSRSSSVRDLSRNASQTSSNGSLPLPRSSSLRRNGSRLSHLSDDGTGIERSTFEAPSVDEIDEQLESRDTVEQTQSSPYKKTMYSNYHKSAKNNYKEINLKKKHSKPNNENVKKRNLKNLASERSPNKIKDCTRCDRECEEYTKRKSRKNFRAQSRSSSTQRRYRKKTPKSTVQVLLTKDNKKKQNYQESHDRTINEIELYLNTIQLNKIANRNEVAKENLIRRLEYGRKMNTNNKIVLSQVKGNIHLKDIESSIKDSLERELIDPYQYLSKSYRKQNNTVINESRQNKNTKRNSLYEIEESEESRLQMELNEPKSKNKFKRKTRHKIEGSGESRKQMEGNEPKSRKNVKSPRKTKEETEDLRKLEPNEPKSRKIVKRYIPQKIEEESEKLSENSNVKLKKKVKSKKIKNKIRTNENVSSRYVVLNRKYLDLKNERIKKENSSLILKKLYTFYDTYDKSNDHFALESNSSKTFQRVTCLDLINRLSDELRQSETQKKPIKKQLSASCIKKKSVEKQSVILNKSVDNISSVDSKPVRKGSLDLKQELTVVNTPSNSSQDQKTLQMLHSNEVKKPEKKEISWSTLTSDSSSYATSSSMPVMMSALTQTDSKLESSKKSESSTSSISNSSKTSSVGMSGIQTSSTSLTNSKKKSTSKTSESQQELNVPTIEVTISNKKANKPNNSLGANLIQEKSSKEYVVMNSVNEAIENAVLLLNSSPMISSFKPNTSSAGPDSAKKKLTSDKEDLEKTQPDNANESLIKRDSHSTDSSSKSKVKRDQSNKKIANVSKSLTDKNNNNVDVY